MQQDDQADVRKIAMLIGVVLAVMVLMFLLIVRIVHSPFGQVLVAIKENGPRAVSLGYDSDRFKLLAFVLSAGIAGLAGSMKVRAGVKRVAASSEASAARVNL